MPSQGGDFELAKRPKVSCFNIYGVGKIRASSIQEGVLNGTTNEGMKE